MSTAGEEVRMRVVSIHSFGGPEVLKLEEKPKPAVGAKQVLIRVRAASVNPVDYKTREGKYPAVKQEHLPTVLGRDVAGKVEQCGANVGDWRRGDDVIAMLDAQTGGYAEYVAIEARLCARAPKASTKLEAAAVPLAGLTAWQGLFDHGRLREGQTVLIHGGAGGVGHFAVQLAKARGAKVATTVSARDIDFARQMGADVVIDYKAKRFESELRDLDLVVDLLGGEVQARSFGVLKRNGALVSTLQRPDEGKLRERGLRGEVYLTQPGGVELEELAQLIDSGKVRPHVSAKFELADAARAQAQLERGGVRGKVVLEVNRD
jgi:NADPH:quinone reductase-like Zn-dependent oxidoreductase